MARLLTVLLLVFATGCPGDPPPVVTPPPRRDAGFDAGPQVFPPRRDAGPVDAGPPDGGGADPRWPRLPGWPADCGIERAVDPAGLFEVSWESCGEGCEVARGNAVPGGAVGSGFTAHVTDRGVYLTVRTFEVATGRSVLVLLAPDGAPVAAWRLPLSGSRCTLRTLAAGGARAAFVAEYRRAPLHEEDFVWIYVAGLDEIGATDTPTFTLDPPRRAGSNVTVGQLWVSDDVIVGKGNANELWEWTAESARRITEPPLDHRVVDVAVLDANTFYLAGTALAHLRRASPPSANEVFYAPGGLDIIAFDGQGDEAVFVTRDFAAFDLWTGTLGEPSGFAPRRVLEDFDADQAIVGGGRAAYLRSRVHVVDLASGDEREHTFPAGVGMSAPLALTPAHLYVPTTDGLYRYDPSRPSGPVVTP